MQLLRKVAQNIGSAFWKSCAKYRFDFLKKLCKILHLWIIKTPIILIKKN